MDAPVSRNFLKIQFLKLISVMTHFVLEKIDWDFQFSEWIRRFWAFSKKFWAFFEKIHFWKFLQVFWPILYGEKILNCRFSIFWMNHWKIKKKFSKNFTSVIFLIAMRKMTVFLIAMRKMTVFLIAMRKMTVFLIVHNINYYEKIKKYYEENVHYYLENTGKI